MLIKNGQYQDYYFLKAKGQLYCSQGLQTVTKSTFQGRGWDRVERVRGFKGFLKAKPNEKISKITVNNSNIRTLIIFFINFLYSYLS